jgi:ornithine--oxo-acid transaminase
VPTGRRRHRSRGSWLHAHAAHNYHPLPVVLADGEGAWVTDVDGRRYLDALAGYSALNFGHRHPRLIAALTPSSTG